MADTTATTSNTKISKTEAVRQALKTLGNDAMPIAISKEIKQRHGLDVSPDYASKMKGYILAQHKAKKPAAKPAVAVKQAAAPQKAAAPKETRDAYHFEDMMSLKELVDRIGLEQVRKLLALFAK